MRRSPPTGRWCHQAEPLPIAAIYVLRPRTDCAAPSIEPIAPADRVFTLATNGYLDRFLSPEMRARDFRVLGRLANTVPIRAIERPDDLAALPAALRPDPEGYSLRMTPTAPRAYFLRSERLGFGTWSADDVDLALGLWGDPAVTRLFGGPFTEAQVRERLAREIATQAEHGVQYWPVFLLDGRRARGLLRAASL